MAIIEVKFDYITIECHYLMNYILNTQIVINIFPQLI